MSLGWPVEPRLLAVATVVLLLAGVLKGSIGFGFPTVAVPALATLVDPRTAVLLVSLPLLLTNVLLLARGPMRADLLRRFGPLLATYLPATLLGGVLLASASPSGLSLIVGAACILAALAALARVDLVAVPPRAEAAASLAMGLGAGLLNGATSVPGPLLAAYLTSLGLTRWTFVYGLTLLLGIGNIAQIASYARLGLYQGGLLLASALLIVPGLLGQQLGFYIQDRLEPETFRRVVLVAVTVSGANLLLRGLGVY